MPASPRLAGAAAAMLLLARQAAAQQAEQAAGTSTATVVSSLILNSAIFGVQMAAFFLIRPRFARIYQPKTMLGPRDERMAPLPRSLFGWLPTFIKTPTIEIMHKQGIDAFQFVDYLEMMIWIFVPIWAFTWILLMPLYSVGTTGEGRAGFNLFNFGAVGPPRSEQLRYIGVLFAQWIVTFWILYNIKARMGAFVTRRQQWLLSPEYASTAQAKTVLITGVPNEYLSERKLEEMYGVLPGGVHKIWLNRNLKELPDLHDDRLAACNKLEKAEAKMIKLAAKKVRKGKVEAAGGGDPEMSLSVADRYVTQKERPSHKLGALGCFGEKVDSVQWARDEIARLNTEIDAQRLNLSDFERYPPQNSAFILFNRQIAAAMAVKVHAHHQPYRMAQHYGSAHPLDIVWPNLNMNPYEQKLRTAIFWGATLGLIIFWIIPVGFVGIVSNIEGLCTQVGFLAWICKIPTEVRGIIQGILPTVLLAVLNLLLPIVLRLFARLSGVPTRTGIELSLMDRFFLFQLINNFLFITIISGASSGIDQIVDVLSNPQGLPSLLAQYIPKASIFFLSYIALQGLTGAASGFLQIVGLAIYYVKNFLLNSTPRSVWHIQHDMNAPNFGTLFPTTSLLSVIAIGYMVIAPITAGFASVSFILFFFLYKYLYLYVYDVKPWNETGGLFFPKACWQLFYALYLEMVILTVLFFVAQDSNGNLSSIPQGVFMIILIVIVAGVHYTLANSYTDLFTAYPLSIAPSGAQEAAMLEEHGSSPDEKKQSLQQQQQQQPPYGNGEHGRNDQSMEMHESRTALVREGNQEEDPALAFQHPATKEPQRTLWFPNDTLGLGNAAVAGAQKQGLEATNRDTSVSEKGRIDTDAHVPPGEVLL